MTRQKERYLNDILSYDSGRILLLVLGEVLHSGGDVGEGLATIEDVTTSKGIGIPLPSTNDVPILVLVEGEDNVVTLGVAVLDNGVTHRANSHSHFSTHLVGNRADFNVGKFHIVLLVVSKLLVR